MNLSPYPSFAPLLSSILVTTDSRQLTARNFIRDHETISSNDSSFKLGFFTPLNATARYVGIWLTKYSQQTIVWVANKDNPLNNTSGSFRISEDGNNLVVMDGNDVILWSSNVSYSSTTNRSARVLDSGNLVLEDDASGEIIWESFKHPSDKFLPSMKFITDTKTNEKDMLTSWNSPIDPSTGNFFGALEVGFIPEFVVWKRSGNIHWRSAPWNGLSFMGIPDMDSSYLSGYNLDIEYNTYTIYVANTTYHGKKYGYVLLSSLGNLEQTSWDDEKQQWMVTWSALQTPCDYYGACGTFGICNGKASPICSCMSGFKPKEEEEWNQGNWSGGCVRKTPLKCQNSNLSEEDGFLMLEMVKVPYFAQWSNSSSSIKDCESKCRQNCSCTAYAYENGLRCMLWNNHLIDIQKFESGGTNLYFRLAHQDVYADEVQDKKRIIITIVVIVLPITLLIFIIAIYFWWRRKSCRKDERSMTSTKEENVFKLIIRNDTIGGKIKLEELPLFDFETLAIATKNFDSSYKLGQGGFGPVYKGRLLDGQEIAIKRLSKASKQGYEEFTNEVIVISKLQHRNLVRLLGCCIEGEEKMLIYEYMPNLSLDAFIFDSAKQKLLDWRKRFNIIDGIARGLLYLHRDSRLRIIHRDLKASNILLDEDLNPKISDFGMARIFCGNELQVNTSRIVGTYGYMSPEYAMQGQFSEKSDIFSFGVLLLEIISGKRNTGFYCNEYALSLLEFAWKLWREDNLISFIDPTLNELCCESKIVRCIQVGLLCVEESINDRPNVGTIISMLNNETEDMPIPKQPSFIGKQLQSNIKVSQSCGNKYSVNNLSLSSFAAR
ncbi:G-type lectin S-receptor-like serine/threonine-protein kinase At1g11330 isoform X2 [Benincasa hispida]|uniref:G-type lectin S-receptor-like serine/threonine-protein kinase At1g11330 isoform X2 n=1 Tax=Benincasa hispida TaxID=102211 RepID=UPI001900B96D|nr:G-type lectin S-receptor-like serine/threonine-protein kinase At1g11330 isoform X2 [Benincasa hispida]XP_038877218.1 G-type lectin S-receptor-like serine/threonine-protein kinase At1g11330 isoform X2 [Benincasa hispida]